MLVQKVNCCQILTCDLFVYVIKGFSLFIPQHLCSGCFSSCSDTLLEFVDVGRVGSLPDITIHGLLLMTPHM
jgi:hypothetical protein